MSYTPGPWSKKAIYSILRFARKSGMDWFEGEGNIPDEEDANLIAAAPELLEALEDCLESWAYGESITEGKAVYDAARAAIAKARGE